MKSKLKQCLLLTATMISGFLPSGFAQSNYEIISSKDNNMKLSGTSTFHDWDMNTENLTGTAQFVFKGKNNEQLSHIKSLSFSLLVQDLKSGQSGLDDNAYKALNADEYKDIVFKLIYAIVSTTNTNKYLVKTVGNLIIAGVTKKVTMDVYCVINNNGTITSSGTYKLKMTDYNVKPPSFMLGVMKTGDDITLNFSMTYEKKPGI